MRFRSTETISNNNNTQQDGEPKEEVAKSMELVDGVGDRMQNERAYVCEVGHMD